MMSHPGLSTGTVTLLGKVIILFGSLVVSWGPIDREEGAPERVCPGFAASRSKGSPPLQKFSMNSASPGVSLREKDPAQLPRHLTLLGVGVTSAQNAQ